MIEYKERVVVITGAASGLGLGLAVELSKRSAIVIMIDIDNERLEKAGREDIKNKYEKIIADVTNADIVKTIFEDIYQ